MKPGPRIDYKALRKVNPETARLAVLQYLKANGRNVSDAAPAVRTRLVLVGHCKLLVCWLLRWAFPWMCLTRIWVATQR